MAAGFRVRAPAWVMLCGLVPCAASAAAPTVTGIQILTPTVNVSAEVASPAIKLKTTGHGTSLSFLYQGPSGEFVSQFFQAPEGLDAVSVVQAYLPFENSSTYGVMLSPYTEPGTWSIATLMICDAQFNCSYYNTSQLAESTFKVVNPHKYDIQAPLPEAGDILTPKVSLASGLPVKIKIQATDNASGVQVVSACASAPGVTSQLCVTAPLPLHVTLAGDFVATAVPPAGTPAGTYTIQSVLLRDVAGNFNVITNPGSIGALFSGGGSASFTITP